MPRILTYDILRIVGVALLTFGLLLLIARAVRLGTRRLVRFLGRWVPRPVAYGIGFAVAVYLVVGFVDGFLVGNLMEVADETASLTNGGTGAGIHAPSGALRSGGAASAVPWQTLGRQGREFVGTGPARRQIGAFTGRPAAEPIRLYAGLDSVGTADERARLVVREMRRTGAFDRAVVAVFTPTGTGWVDSDVTRSLEYMYSGDTALVSMQYSYLPSWISFLFDRAEAAAAASALITAVHDRWAAMPAATRPKLLIFGESLGSYGTELTFGSAAKMVAGADGILLEGPTFANPIHQQLTEHREPGSTVWEP